MGGCIKFGRWEHEDCGDVRTRYDWDATRSRLSVRTCRESSKFDEGQEVEFSMIHRDIRSIHLDTTRETKPSQMSYSVQSFTRAIRQHVQRGK